MQIRAGGGRTESWRTIKMDLHPGAQRDIAAYTTGAAIKARRGDLFLGSARRLGDEMRKCICGLCVSSDGPSQSQCTVFAEDGMKLVERKQTDICRPVCISKNSVRMIQRVIRSLLQAITARRTGRDSFLRISLQQEDSTTFRAGAPPSRKPYLFDVDYFDGQLEGVFVEDLYQLGHEEHDHFRFTYSIGEAISFEQHMSATDYRRLKQMLDRALIEGDGKPFSLVVVCDELPPLDFDVYGLRFRAESHGVFRARPVYLFLQAYPQ